MRERFMGIFFETPAAPDACWQLACTRASREAVEKSIPINLSPKNLQVEAASSEHKKEGHASVCPS